MSAKPLVASLLSSLVGLVLMAVLLFGVAGSASWVEGWIFLGLWASQMLLPPLVLGLANPSLLERRSRGRKDGPQYDRVLARVFMTLVFALPLAAGLTRAGLGPRLPAVLLWPGIGLGLAGTLVQLWALIANPFFEATHRVQVEYGHRVVQAGPYRLVRHPGYLGVMLEAAGAAAVLGSCLACLPAAGIGAAMWARAAFEDRALRRDIDGYEAYTKRTRSLVLPGIPW